MQRRILIIDDHDDLATALSDVFTEVGHDVTSVESRTDALKIPDIDSFDIVITDLDINDPALHQADDEVCLPNPDPVKQAEHLKAFKLCAANFHREQFLEDDLKNFVETILNYKVEFVDREDVVSHMHEHIEFELPSSISVMNSVLAYLMKRVEKLEVVDLENSNLFVALDEAFVNAVKHGNKYDSSKLVKITAEVSRHEARFIIEDEGDGFDVNSIPDPLDPANLFKTSGRGVLFIHNIMDEVAYNDRGNRLTMVKKSSKNGDRS